MKADARSIGPIARQALERATEAKVIASFDRSFYLDVGDQIICMVDERLYDGPLNLLVRTEGRKPNLFDLPSPVGQLWTVRDTILQPYDKPAISIEFGASANWLPKLMSWSSLDRRQVEGSFEHLKKLIAAGPRREGLLGLVMDPTIGPASALERAARTPIRQLQKAARCWLAGGDPDPVMVSLDGLLGLGPGLTPSGDDMIAGLMITAHHLGKGEAASALWHQLEGEARHRTHPISFAHLAAAGRGMGAASLHDLLDALIENRIEPIAKGLDAVAKIGHCSGWDAVGGLFLLLNAWVDVSKEQSIAA